MTLAAPMLDGDLRLEPAAEAHREPLRAACALDADIWEIYPTRFLREDFDRNFDTLFDSPANVPFMIFEGDRLIGMTSFLAVDRASLILEIGRTYIVPDVRGTGLNRRVKTMLLDRAFAEGFGRVSFRVDTRNQRSMAAVLKLGATHEGTLRKERITWTGHVRDTAIFSILADEWAELRSR
jgi:RimJ/RimL family protein N-acetyltransferase